MVWPTCPNKTPKPGNHIQFLIHLHCLENSTSEIIIVSISVSTVSLPYLNLSSYHFYLDFWNGLLFDFLSTNLTLHPNSISSMLAYTPASNPSTATPNLQNMIKISRPIRSFLIWPSLSHIPSLGLHVVSCFCIHLEVFLPNSFKTQFKNEFKNFEKSSPTPQCALIFHLRVSL